MIPGKITSLEPWLTGLYFKISLPPSFPCLSKQSGVVLWSASASLLWSGVLLQKGFLSKSLSVRGLCSEVTLSSLPNLLSITPSLLFILSLEIPGSCHIFPTVAKMCLSLLHHCTWARTSTSSQTVNYPLSFPPALLLYFCLSPGPWLTCAWKPSHPHALPSRLPLFPPTPPAHSSARRIQR